jgi:hypothetical protein
MVLTRERGYTPIQEVMVGEQVLTHEGRWRAVTIVRMTGVQRTITLRGQGIPGLTLTPDHKLWTRKSYRAREREGAERAEPDWIEAKDSLGGYVNFKLPESEETTNSDLNHWWIVGRWLADGHWESGGCAIISCGIHKIGELVAQLGSRLGGVYDTQTCKQARVLDSDGSIKETLRECGHGAGEKHLPPEAFTLPIKQSAALLAGYLSGDGNYQEDIGRYLATSVSRDLLMGLSVLVQRVHGSIASIYPGRPERESEIEGRSVKCKQEWVLCFYLTGERRKKPFILEDGAWKKVRSLEDSGEVETWCLRVEEDESFTAEGCIVKNCPMQFDLADRVINQMSNPGDLILDPFSGLGTVPFRAVALGRKGYGVELNPAYFAESIAYCKAAEEKIETPTLFDMLETESSLEVA